MNSKNRKVSCDFSDAYKELPLAMRVRVNQTASTLLELQKENAEVLANAEELSLEEDRRDVE